MGRKQLSHGIQTGENNEKTTFNGKESRQRMHLHLFVRGNIWAGPWAGPSNPQAGPHNRRAGPYRVRVLWAPFICHGPSREGPRRLKNVGPGRAEP